MPTEAEFFDDSAFNDVLRALTFSRRWDSGAIGYHLAFSDHDRDGRNDWDEDGARSGIERAFATWAEIAELTFTPTSLASATLVERINDAGGALGRHNLPNGTQTEGEYNKDGSGWNIPGLVPGGYGFITLIHEIGHALGLEHPFDDDVLPGVGGPFTRGWYDLNQGINTVMAYDDGWAVRGTTGREDGYGWTGTPMAFDVAAIQAMYGANMSTRTGNDTYQLRDGNGAGTFYSTIWDAGGQDEVRYDGARDAFVFLDEATIDATATGGGLVSYVDGVFGGFTIAQGAVIENARTGSGDDLIVGNDAANVLIGNAGNDTIFGMGGGDRIEGGAGDDLIVLGYESPASLGGSVAPDASGPDLPLGFAAGVGSLRVDQFSNNGTRSAAIDVDRLFARQSGNAEVIGGEDAYSLRISATGGGAFDYYEFTLAERALFVADIDGAFTGGFDSALTIFDSRERQLAQNDDSRPSQGGTGSTYDYDDFSNKQTSLDSYIAVLLEAGTYVIEVSELVDRELDGTLIVGGIPSNATYRLNLSVDTGVPSSIPTDALGQVAYYYEQPDYGDVAAAAFAGGGGLGGSGLPAKEGAHHHGDGCGCGCHDHGKPDPAQEGGVAPVDIAASDEVDVELAALFAFQQELDALHADGDYAIA